MRGSKSSQRSNTMSAWSGMSVYTAIRDSISDLYVESNLRVEEESTRSISMAASGLRMRPPALVSADVAVSTNPSFVCRAGRVPSRASANAPSAITCSSRVKCTRSASDMQRWMHWREYHRENELDGASSSHSDALRNIINRSNAPNP